MKTGIRTYNVVGISLINMIDCSFVLFLGIVVSKTGISFEESSSCTSQCYCEGGKGTETEENRKNQTSGTVYVRWGRNICQEDATLIYKGYVGGNLYSKSGSGTDSICLPSDPVWSNYKDGLDDNRGHIYGTEFDEADTKIFGISVYQQNVPCAVCKTHHSALIMIPARSECYSGWKEEYTGYLMTAYHSHAGSHNHICVDSQPEFIPGGAANNNEHILYLVEARCGSLPCPPYAEGRELPCVVCSL